MSRGEHARRASAALPVLAWLACAAVPALTGCKGGAAADDAGAGPSGSAAQAAPQPTFGLNSVAERVPEDRPKLGITAFVGTVYAEPRETAKKLGYLRVGSIVARSAEPAGNEGCKGGWYEIFPRGFVCAGKEATLDLEDPVLKAASKRPDRIGALPYRYAFVRAVAPLYLRVPTKEEQLKSEFKLAEHLEWYAENKSVVQQVTLGAHDVPLDDRGVPIPGKKLGELGLAKNSLELPLAVHLGGETDADPPPFWLEGGKRAIPNISDFVVPEYAVFADRVRRHTGLALVGSFPTGPESLERRFAITTDLRLVPATKIKPDTGSPWHGVELGEALTLPIAFVRSQSARAYKVEKNEASEDGALEHRSVHALTGKMKRASGVRYYRTKDGRFLKQDEVGLAIRPSPWPEAAEKGEKWVDISITQQTLVLWEGKTPIYATLVSTGKDGMDNPRTSHATVRGIFRIRNKHVTATMDSDGGSSVGGRADTTASRTAPSERADKAPTKGAKARGKDYVPQKGDGVYGVTRRRGEGTFQLKDVPYIQYFAAGYAIHAAYWHDVFGTPRSHGCINLSPIDAHRVFNWTDPAVPEGWHAVNAGDGFGEGTTVVIHE